MSGQLWEWGNDISFYATLHCCCRCSALSALPAFSQLCSKLTNRLGTGAQTGAGFQLPAAGRGGTGGGGLNWKRWPHTTLEGRVASSEHSKLQCTIWTLRPWALRSSAGLGTGCRRRERSICAQPPAQGRGETGIGVTWFLMQECDI